MWVGVLALCVVVVSLPQNRFALLEKARELEESQPEGFDIKHIRPENPDPEAITQPICPPSVTRFGFMDYLDVIDASTDNIVCGCVCEAVKSKECLTCPHGAPVFDKGSSEWRCPVCKDGNMQDGWCLMDSPTPASYTLMCPIGATGELVGNVLTCTSVCEDSSEKVRSDCEANGVEVGHGDCVGEMSFTGFAVVEDQVKMETTLELECHLRTIVPEPIVSDTDGATIVGIRCKFRIEATDRVDPEYEMANCMNGASEFEHKYAPSAGVEKLNHRICWMADDCRQKDAKGHSRSDAYPLMFVNSACGPGAKERRLSASELVSDLVCHITPLSIMLEKYDEVTGYSTLMEAATRSNTNDGNVDEDAVFHYRNRLLQAPRLKFKGVVQLIVDAVNTLYKATECMDMTSIVMDYKELSFSESPPRPPRKKKKAGLQKPKKRMSKKYTYEQYTTLKALSDKLLFDENFQMCHSPLGAMTEKNIFQAKSSQLKKFLDFAVTKPLPKGGSFFGTDRSQVTEEKEYIRKASDLNKYRHLRKRSMIDGARLKDGEETLSVGRLTSKNELLPDEFDALVSTTFKQMSVEFSNAYTAIRYPKLLLCASDAPDRGCVQTAVSASSLQSEVVKSGEAGDKGGETCKSMYQRFLNSMPSTMRLTTLNLTGQKHMHISINTVLAYATYVWTADLSREVLFKSSKDDNLAKMDDTVRGAAGRIVNKPSLATHVRAMAGLSVA